MKKALALPLTLLLAFCCTFALAEEPLTLDSLMTEIEAAPKAVSMGELSFEVSEDKQSIYIDRPEVSGAANYTIAYNIYDSNSVPVNYFYSDAERVAATPGYGGLFNVFVVVTDTDTKETASRNIGWTELDWPHGNALTVSKATFELSGDKKSIYVDRPEIRCKSGRVTIAYNIYDSESKPVNYFYSTEKRVAATPGYDGKFNVFIVVTDPVTGEQDVQNIGWQILGEPAAPISVGDHVTFGRYPQTASGTDLTPIEWVVLDIQDGKALLISKYGPDAKQYYPKWTNVTWETCSLRAWLNSDFLQKAFNAAEQSAILTTLVDNSSAQCFRIWTRYTYGGNDTQDQIFLLSYAEANRYYGVTWEDSGNVNSRAAPTAYAAQQGAFASDDHQTADGQAAGWWWLRSPGSDQGNAAIVLANGALNEFAVHRGSGSVRPVLWVRLDAGIL